MNVSEISPATNIFSKEPNTRFEFSKIRKVTEQACEIKNMSNLCLVAADTCSLLSIRLFRFAKIFYSLRWLVGVARRS